MDGECRRRTSRGQPEYPSARSSGSTPAWIDDVAPLPEAHLDRIAARWIDLIEYEECDVATDDKPMLRGLAGDLVAFCHRAEGAEDVLFARSLKWRAWVLAPGRGFCASSPASSMRARQEPRSTRPERHGSSSGG